MTIRNSWKRVIASTLAVLVVAGAGAANVSLDKLFGGIAITASAAEYDDVSAFNSASEADPVLKLNQNVGEIYITRADGTVDLNGYTVTNLFLQNNDPNKTVTVKNGTVSNKIDGQTGWNADFAGKVVLEDLTVKGNTWADGHIVTIKSGEYNTIQNGTNFSDSPKSVVNIEGGSFTNLVIGSHGEKYSISGGSFANKPEESYLAEGVSFVQNENGEFVIVSLVTGIELDKTDITLKYGETANITETVTPADAVNKRVIYTVCDKSVIDFEFNENGGIKIITKGIGTTTITATADSSTETTDDDKTAVCNVTVTKADSSVTKAPAANTLAYTGDLQELVQPGEAEGGKLVYLLEGSGDPLDNSAYSESVPSAKDVGKYKVWYKVIGDDQHNDTEAASVDVEITDPRINFYYTTVTVDTEKKAVSVELDEELDGKKVPEEEYTVLFYTYEKTENDVNLTEIGSDFPTEPGTYIAVATANEESKLYVGANASDTFTVEAAPVQDSSESTPDSSTPESSEPESSTPDSSEPDSSTPDSSEPESSKSESKPDNSSNPKTGAAAAGIGLAAVVTAAAITIKRKK